MMYRILITDSLCRKAFDIISILKHRFSATPLITGVTSKSCLLTAYAKFLYHSTTVLIRTNNYSLFYSDLLSLSETYSDDFIIFVPVEEDTVELFLSFIEKYGKLNFVYLLPDKTIFDLARNKSRLNHFCLDSLIPAPKMYTIEELSGLSDVDYPIILKPCVGSGSKGIVRLMKKDDFSHDIKETVTKEPYVIQELLPNGNDVKGAFFLFSNGHCMKAYAHKRIRTSPAEGGVTVLSEIYVNEMLINAGEKLLNKLNWNGLVMLEFLYDPHAGKYKVIEANPRLWGSIMLSEYSGNNLLTDYISLCMGDSPRNLTPKFSRIRWLFPVDFFYYIKQRGKIVDFWNFNDTCLINWTYANKMSAIAYNIISLFNPHNIMRFFRK